MLCSNSRLFAEDICLDPVGLKSILSVLLLLFVWGCSNSDTEQNSEHQREIRQALEGRLLAAGPEDIEILASANTNDQIKVGIQTPTSIDPLNNLPPELSLISDVYGLEANRQVIATKDEWFAISFPLPPGVDPENLVLTMWTPSESDFTPEYNFLDEEPPTDGHWHVLDGEIASGRFYAAFYAFEDLEYLFALAEGEWFGPSSIYYETIVNDATSSMPQGLSGGGTFSLEVQCEHNDNDVCTYEQRDILAAYFIETMREFADRSMGNMTFPEPRLKKPLFGNADYRIYLRMMKPRKTFPLRKCRYWPEENGTVNGTTGRYNALDKRITICIWPKAMAAPTLEIVDVIPGTALEINIDTKSYIATVRPGEDDSAIAARLAEMIRQDTPEGTAINKSLPAESFGNRIALHYDNDMRDIATSVEAKVLGGLGSIRIVDFEYARLHTSTHEYFHALQWGAAGLKFIANNTYAEGAAVTAQRGRYIEDNYVPFIQRDPTRSLRQLDIPLFLDGEVDEHAYQSQDFYVYVGHLLRTFDEFKNTGFEWIIPLMADRGSLQAHRNTMALYGLPLSSVYSAFARNQFFEKSYALDDYNKTWSDPCSPDSGLFTRNSGLITVPYNGGPHEETITLSSYSSKAMEITFDPAHHGSTYIIEAVGNKPWTTTTIYPPQSGAGGCTGKFESISRKVVEIGPGADTVHILISATETDDATKVTIRPASTNVKLHLRDDEVRVSSRPISITGEYEAEAGPVIVSWIVNNQIIATQSYTEPTGNISHSLYDRCLLGSIPIIVRLEDAHGTQAWDSATIQMTSENTMLSIEVPGGYSCGATHELPLNWNQLPPGRGRTPNITVNGFVRSCGPRSSPSKLSWQAFLPDGTVKTEYGAVLLLNQSDFRDGNSYGNITLQLSHDDIPGSVRRTLRPCLPFIQGGASVGACTPEKLCYDNMVVGPDIEVHRMKEHIDIAMTYEYRIERSLNGVIPEPFPRPTETLHPKLEYFLSPALYSILTAISVALDANSIPEFSLAFDNARQMVQTLYSGAERSFALNIIALVENHIYFYSNFNHGGAGGWHDYSFLSGWAQRKPVNPIKTAGFAFRYALSAWIDLYERSLEFSLTGNPLELDDPNTLDRIVQVGTDGAALEIISDPPEDQ